jgi:hypothetical protein
VTGCGRLVSVVAPPALRADLAIRLPGATLALAGAVSAYSLTVASTASSGTTDFRCEARAYAANSIGASAPGAVPAAVPGRWVTTSRETTLAAGVSAATMRPSASSCWQTVTNRALCGVRPGVF